jgi:hypothetical protein
MTDEELQQIIEEGEAGIADLIAVYGEVESEYMQAANAAAGLPPASAVTTSTLPPDQQ